MRKGWLRRQLDLAAAEVATWPEWKRKMYAEYLSPNPDPRWTCRHRRVCDWHQTCGGKPCVTGPARPSPEG
jgi:hypothetical protein